MSLASETDRQKSAYTVARKPPAWGVAFFGKKAMCGHAVADIRIDSLKYVTFLKQGTASYIEKMFR
jgi:hypothetical protein